MTTHRPGLVLPVTRYALAVLLISTLFLQTHSAMEASQDVFTVAIAGDIVSLDPALATDHSSSLVATQIFDTLATYEPSGVLPAPGLAQRWTTSADGRTWTFFLRSDAVFHDGTVLNANAVVFNLQRWWDPAHPYHQGNFSYFQAIFGGFRGDPNCLIQDISASGTSTVVIQLSRPVITLPSSLALPFFSIASPAAVQAGTLSSEPVGTGPFRFIQRTPGDRIELEANTHYWRGAPHSSRLLFRVIPNPTDRLAALQASVVQLADDLASPAADPELRVLTRPLLSVAYLGINSDHEPFGNLLVRQAIAHAVDKRHLQAAGYTGGAQIADQFLPHGLWGRDPSIVDYNYNPTLARTLLTQAGYPAGITTTLAYRNVVRGYMPNPQVIAQVLRADMAAAGINLEVQEMESGDFLDAVYSGELDLFLLGWGADIPHPDNFFTPHFCPPAGFGSIDVELCNQLATARATRDIAGQEAIYRWASRRVHETLPLVPIANSSSAFTTRFDVVGVVASPVGAESYWEAEVIAGTYTEVTPADGGTLSFADAAGQATTVSVPPAAVAQSTTLHLLESDVRSAPVHQRSAHHAFDLQASSDGVPLEDFAFARPVSVTISYSDADIYGLQESTLTLYRWRAGVWEDASAGCSLASADEHDQASNQISLVICQAGQFALFGERAPFYFLPFIVRD